MHHINFIKKSTPRNIKSRKCIARHVLAKTMDEKELETTETVETPVEVETGMEGNEVV